MTTQNQPVHHLRIGRLTAAIWENTNGEGQTYFSVTFSRIYKNDNGWQQTDSFGRHDLLRLAKLADQADTWITGQLQESRDDESATGTLSDGAPY